MEGKIDEKDRRIIEVLKEHADYATRQIAKKTGLPITTVHNHIQKLKKEKIIKRFTVDLDYHKLQDGFRAYVLVSVNLSLLKEKKKSQYDVSKELKQFSFVERADIVSGGTDIVATVRVKDVAEFDQVLLTKLQRIEGIEKTQSLIVIHEE
ncbi:Lrp/AsnC family transcriptional regulator [Candidatus Woesearchaeota archaeon]|nr:Lrp/AsnC family transcriptional regulator [Candidatus Woesearchaeota archaeon]MBI2582216.1 Lrp/AsnC family transcriptional regulator [Candidatus Woesearchaeota archaeon]